MAFRDETGNPRSQRTATQNDSTVPTPNDGEYSGLLLLTSLSYGTFNDSSARDFFDLDNSYLANTKSLGPVKSVSVIVSSYRIQGYRISFDEHPGLLPYISQEYAYCPLDYDEYINSLTLTWEKEKPQFPKSIRFGTSKGKSCASGEDAEIQVTLNPPKGWRIVGLHGSGYKGPNYQLLYAVGAIYAPIQIGISS